jgi:DNA-binding protein HU-beta
MRQPLAARLSDEMSFDGDPADSFGDVGDYSEERDEELFQATVAADPVPPPRPLPPSAVTVVIEEIEPVAEVVAFQEVVPRAPFLVAAPRKPVARSDKKPAPASKKAAAAKKIALVVKKSKANRTNVSTKKAAAKKVVAKKVVVKKAAPAKKAVVVKKAAAAPAKKAVVKKAAAPAKKAVVKKAAPAKKK